MNALEWLASWVPDRDGRAIRLPISVFGLVLTGVQAIGLALFEGLPLLAVLPFIAVCVFGWMIACDTSLLVVDRLRGRQATPARVEADLKAAAVAPRRNTRLPVRIIAPPGGVASRAGGAQVSTPGLVSMACPPTVH